MDLIPVSTSSPDFKLRIVGYLALPGCSGETHWRNIGEALDTLAKIIDTMRWIWSASSPLGLGRIGDSYQCDAPRLLETGRTCSDEVAGPFGGN